jgi:signal transduction histidine kinase
MSATEEELRARLATLLRHETEAFIGAFTSEVESLRTRLNQQGINSDPALERMQSLVAELADRMQSIAREEQPPPIEEIGLERALEGYCQHICDKTALELSYESHIQETAIDKTVKLTAFRVAQDTLEHIAEHRRPNFVSVRVTQEGTELQLRVEDVGEPHVVKHESDEQSEVRFLQRLEERVASLAGRVQVNRGLGSNLLLFALPTNAPRPACTA